MKTFITGTNTGVGKTFVASQLCRFLNKKKKKVGVIKPVETGVINNKPQDTILLIKAASSSQGIDEACSYRFKYPASPHRASIEENKKIDYNRIVDHINHLDSEYDILVIEGAGGLLVPVTEKKTYLDLIRDTGSLSVVVAPAGLGTINSTSLTVQVLRGEGIEPICVVLNDINNSAGELGTKNQYDLIAYLDIPVFYSMYKRGLSEQDLQFISDRLLSNNFIRISKKIVSFIGRSGSGKTTLISKIISLLSDRISVTAFKHASSELQLDTPGKDSYLHFKAGSNINAISGPNRSAIFYNFKADKRLINKILYELSKKSDVVLVEGFKGLGFYKIITAIDPSHLKIIDEISSKNLIIGVSAPVKLKDLIPPYLKFFPLDKPEILSKFIMDFVDQKG